MKVVENMIYNKKYIVIAYPLMCHVMLFAVYVMPLRVIMFILCDVLCCCMSFSLMFIDVLCYAARVILVCHYYLSLSIVFTH